jgi:hypothetical protein
MYRHLMKFGVLFYQNHKRNIKESIIMKNLRSKLSNTLVYGLIFMTAMFFCATVRADSAAAGVISIDCYKKGLDNTGTMDWLLITYWNNGDTEPYYRKNVKHVECRPEQEESMTSRVIRAASQGLSRSDAVKQYDIVSDQGPVPDYFIIQTQGGDAFWMDSVRLNGTKWGDDGGKGYCLSEQENDASASNFKGNVFYEKCFKALKFTVADRSSDPTDPIALFNSEKYVFSHILEIDCYDSSMKNENTKNTITVAFYDGSTLVGKTTLAKENNKKEQLCGYTRDSLAGFNSTRKVTHIDISTDGTDGFWMDEVYYSILNYHDSAHWGRDGGKGYCLSKDPKDAKGSNFKGKVDGCHSAIRFDVKSNKAYPL